MIKKVISYLDYDGNQRKDTLMFDISESELLKLELKTPGGTRNKLQRIIDENDTAKIVEYFDDFIKLSYGRKSDDGKRFVKNEEILNEFLQSPAYNALFMELISDADKAAAFINGIIPKELAEKVSGQLTLVETTKE